MATLEARLTYLRSGRLGDPKPEQSPARPAEPGPRQFEVGSISIHCITASCVRKWMGCTFAAVFSHLIGYGFGTSSSGVLLDGRDQDLKDMS